MTGAVLIRFGLTAALCAGLLSVRAAVVPAEADLEAARPGVETLTEADLLDLKAGRKSHSEIAGAFLSYAGTSEDPAARYLLVRAAYRQFVLGGELVQVMRLQTDLTVREGSLYAMEIARFSAPLLNRLVSSKTPGAKEFLSLLAAVDRRIKDESSAPYLTFEERYPRTGLTALTTADMGDFWWQAADESDSDPLVRDSFRLHAATWYARALTNGTVRAEMRKKALRRCTEAKASRESALAVFRAMGVDVLSPNADPDQSPSSPVTPSLASSGPVPASSLAGTSSSSAAPAQPDSIILAPQRNMTIEFRQPRDATPSPVPSAYLITPWRITYEQFRGFRKIPKYENGVGGADPSDPVRVTYDEALDFAKWIMRKCRGKMPAGATVRLPTPEERPQAPERGELLKDGEFRGIGGFFLVLETPKTELAAGGTAK